MTHLLAHCPSIGRDGLFVFLAICAGAGCSSRHDDGATHGDASAAPRSEAGARDASQSSPSEGDSGGSDPIDRPDAVKEDDGPSAPCEEPMVRCGSSCVRLEEDPSHCGGCNHDCQGSECALGICAPEVLVEATLQAASSTAYLSADGESLAWAFPTGGPALYFAVGEYGLGTVPPGTTTSLQLLDSSALQTDGPDRLAQHGAFLYWAETSTGNIMRAPLAGGEGSTALLAHQAGPSSLLTDGTNLYWSNTIDHTLVAAPLDGSVTKVLAQSAVRGMQLDGPYLYWIETIGNRVLRMNKLGGKVTVLADGPDRIDALSVGSRRVFWMTNFGAILATAK